MNKRVLKHRVLAYHKPQLDGLCIVIYDFVIFDVELGRLTAVFRGVGCGEMPFDTRRARHQGHIVEVNETEVELEFRLDQLVNIATHMRGPLLFTRLFLGTSCMNCQ